MKHLVIVSALLIALLSGFASQPVEAATMACPGLCSGGTCGQYFVTLYQCIAVALNEHTLCSQWIEPCYLIGSVEDGEGKTDAVRLAETDKDLTIRELLCQRSRVEEADAQPASEVEPILMVLGSSKIPARS